MNEQDLEKLISSKFIDIFIRLGLITFLVVYCYQIFSPLIGLMLWSIILAVALYPLHGMVSRKINGQDGRAATILVLAILLSVFVPSSLLAFSFADSATELVKQVQNGSLQVPEPKSTVAAWPIIGEQLYALWSSAHQDLGAVIAKYEPKIAVITKQILHYAASAGTAILMFLVSLVISGIWMANGSSSHAAAQAIARRMAGEQYGNTLVTLSTATIRAVAQGVIGIACIQALLLGAGFILIGIPAAGLLALIVLLLGIAQIPAAIISLPAIAYVLSTHDFSLASIIFAVYTRNSQIWCMADLNQAAIC